MSHSKYIRVLDDFYDKNFPEFIALRTKVHTCSVYVTVRMLCIIYSNIILAYHSAL